MAAHQQLQPLAKILILVGGIVLVVGAVLTVVNVEGFLGVTPRLRSFGGIADALVGIIAGALAIAGSRQVSSLAWSIILLVLGILVSGLGGALVFVGALIALILNFVKS